MTVMAGNITSFRPHLWSWSTQLSSEPCSLPYHCGYSLIRGILPLENALWFFYAVAMKYRRQLAHYHCWREEEQHWYRFSRRCTSPSIAAAPVVGLQGYIRTYATLLKPIPLEYISPYDCKKAHLPNKQPKKASEKSDCCPMLNTMCIEYQQPHTPLNH